MDLEKLLERMIRDRVVLLGKIPLYSKRYDELTGAIEVLRELLDMMNNDKEGAQGYSD